jgi:hypothetical protein
MQKKQRSYPLDLLNPLTNFCKRIELMKPFGVQLVSVGIYK